MHKFIQRNRKKLLAVFGVLLMIVFIIPSTFKNSGTPDDVTVGKVGDEKISSADVRRAAQELQMLQRPLMQLMFMGRSTSGSVPVMFQIVNQCREKPSIYVVLQKEAAAAGVVAPDAEVDELMQRLGGGTTGRDAEDLKAALQRLLSVQLNFERVASQIKVTLPELGKGIIERQEPALNLVEFKAEDYLAGVPNPPDAEVQKAWEKYASVSPDAAGAAMQAVKFGYLVPEKVKLQYIKLPIDRLRNAAFLSLSDNDLVAIDRVAILYYSKNNEEFSTPAFDEREIVAGPFTKPATRPASGPVLKPFREVRDELRRRVVFGTFTPDPSTPAEYKDAVEAVKKKFAASIDQLRQRFHDRLEADYQAHLKGEPILLEAVPAPRSATQPATQPATQTAEASPATAPSRQPAPAFESVAYMEAVFQNVLEVAAKGEPLTPPVQKKKGRSEPPELTADLEPLGRKLDDKWYTKSDLNALSEISGASAGNDRFAELALRSAPTGGAGTQPTTGPATQPTAASPATAPSTTVSTPATSEAATAPSTAPATQPAGPVVGPIGKSAWALYQPSPLLKSGEDADAFVFRLTGYEPQRVPPLDEVREQIVRDLKTMQAFRVAHDKAESTYKDVLARKDDGKGLAYMAEATGMKLFQTGPIPRQHPMIQGYSELDSFPLAAQMLAGASQGLLQKVTTSDPHPLQVVDLPPARRTVIAEVRAVQRGWTAGQDYEQQRMILQRLQTSSQLIEQRHILEVWLNPEEVTRRTGYQTTGHGG